MERVATSGRARRYVSAGVTVVGVLALWELLTTVGHLPNYKLPAPWPVAREAATLFSSGGFMSDLAVTGGEVWKGVLIGGALGVVGAALFFHIRWIELVGMPLVVIAQVTPKISIAPLLILWMGLGATPKIFLVALVTFFPVLTMAGSALRGMSSDLVALCRLLGMSSWSRFRRVEGPVMLPAIAAGLRLGALQGVTAAVIGELMGAEAGLGYAANQGAQNDNIGETIVAVLVLCALGLAMYAMTGLLLRVATRNYAAEEAGAL